jgi:tetratricopeptide (TPR) repeat protein
VPGFDLEDEEESAPVAADSTSFEGLITSFGEPSPELGPVLLLGLRQPLQGQELALDWLWPRTLDVAGLQTALRDALATQYKLSRGPALQGKIAEDVELLFGFAADPSLEASTIARANRAFGTGAVFLGTVARRPPGAESACGGAAHLEIELRMLAGQLSGNVSALGNRLCLSGGLERYGIWNLRAGGIYLVVLLLIGFPFVRGWGRVLVTFKFPPKTKPLFSVRLSQRKRRSVKVDDTGDQVTNKWRIEEKLQRISPFEKRLTGDRLQFRWVPARRKPYIVTVKGPMLDAKTGELVGAYQEEKTVKVERGREVVVEFDMRLKECSIEVNVYLDAQHASQAAIALKGVKNSLRYARGKAAFLYVGEGEHHVVVGSNDRVIERTVQVEDLEPVRMSFDLSNEDNLLFWGCAEAVMPYLEGRYLEAADALERAGNSQLANQLRGEGHLQLGDKDAAASAFEAAGNLVGAAELHAEGDNSAASAVLFEEAGEYGRAAQVYREQGDIVAAARAHERAYDWDSAAECYRELGDSEGLMNALEQAGEYFEAAQIAEELTQIPRALHNYQQIDRRNGQYSDVCCRVAVLLTDKGEPDLAIEKLQEAQERMLDLFPIAMETRLASLQEEVGRDEDALTTYESIRRRDHNDATARERITEIKKRIETAQQQTLAATVAASPAAAQAPQESRYEILGELGRGGMGVVFKARDTNLGRIVALKKLPENLKEHPTAVKLFLREARSAAALNHPNIVTVFDAGQESDNYFISMEHLQGTPLDALLEAHGRISPRDTALLGMQAATGLAYAHDHRIIHRDIKSSNLFYTTDRVVKIMDFGLAKAVEEVRRNASMIAGTPYFMAPEQSAGDVVDHRADLYALGVTLYQLATGSVPFTEGDVTYHHRHTPPPDPRQAVPDMPAALAELLLQLLAKEPDDRVQSAAEVSQRLRTIAESAPS